MKDALAVQVLQPSGNIQRQTDPDAPRQIQVTVQQLLQVTSVYVLQGGRDGPMLTQTDLSSASFVIQLTHSENIET